MLVSGQVMAYPDLSKPYKVYCDASDHTIGGVMTQDDDQGLETVVQYISHQLSRTQQNWATIEKECYAVVYCLLKLRPYLYGHGHPVTVLTDHRPLRSLFTKQFHNTKIERWSVLLSEYQADIKYIQGKRNLKADMLSRIPPQPIPPPDDGVVPLEMAILDTQDWVSPDAFLDEDAIKRIPLEADNLNYHTLLAGQLGDYGPEGLRPMDPNDDTYDLYQGLIYSLVKPTLNSVDHP
jgi:hypothetical protein